MLMTPRRVRTKFRNTSTELLMLILLRIQVVESTLDPAVDFIAGTIAGVFKHGLYRRKLLKYSCRNHFTDCWLSCSVIILREGNLTSLDWRLE